MFWDKQHQMTFQLENFLFISIKHEISAVVDYNLSRQTNEQPTSDRLTANRGTAGITFNLQRFAAGYMLSRMSKFTFIHSLVTCSLLYIPQDFPLFVIIFLINPTTASHGSTNTSTHCELIWIKPNVWHFIQCAPGWDPAATQTPVSPPRHCNCSHWKYDPWHLSNKWKLKWTL